MTSNSPVCITGTGVVSCAGNSPDELWIRIMEGVPGLKNGLGAIPRHPSQNLSLLAFDLCRAAAIQAMNQAGWSELKEDDGIILGTTTGQILAWDQSLIQLWNGQKNIQEFRRDFITQPLGFLLNQVTGSLGYTPHQQVFSSACTAATQAIAMANLWIQQGRVKRCLVGGVEVLCDLTIEGFKSLQLLSMENSKPFSQTRNGINLSEGAAFICLEKPTDKNKALAQISGVGLSTDAYHMTSPHPEGRGCKEAITNALGSAELEPHEIDWIHAHGTGSFYNDLSEGIAIQSIFGEQSPYVCSTKSIHGHALGASGLLETVVCVKALKHQMLLRTPRLVDPDPAIPVRHLPQNFQKSKIQHILKMTLGFGGANAALILSHPSIGTAHVH